MAPDAGRFSEPLYAQCEEAPPAEAVDGGWLFSTQRASRVSCLLVSCDERRLQLEPQPVPPTSLVLSLVSLAVGLALGAWGGFEVARWILR